MIYNGSLIVCLTAQPSSSKPYGCQHSRKVWMAKGCGIQKWVLVDPVKLYRSAESRDEDIRIGTGHL